jgi:transposase
MITLDFSPQDLDALHFERSHHPHPRVRLKREAVSLKSQGLAHPEIGRRARISEDTLRSYLRQYPEGGGARLKQTDGDGPTGELSVPRQAPEEHFRKDPPRSTAEAAADLERLTGVKRGLTQVRKPLKGMGLKSPKPGMIPAKADPAEQGTFLDERLWPRLRQARRPRRVACFVGAAHFVHGPFLGSLWCLVRLPVRGPSGRERRNVPGAIDAVTRELTTAVNDTVINAEAVGESLRKLSARSAGRPLTRVRDNARYQRCEAVKRVAEGLRIESLSLPAYPPDLDRIERLWRFVKEEVLSCRYYEDFARFKAAIVDCRDQVEGEHKAAIASLLTLKFQTFEQPQLLAG